jgi:crotonobetainyl-CoA:carnitine CoA-transferase CaiB-like acyl-CoA transferase
LSEDHARALAGLRVLSFGSFIAGNRAGLLLAELGADVVKIEARERPEVLRMPVYAIGPPATEPSGVPQTLLYATLSRGVRSLSMDIHNEATRPLFLALARRADVLIENFAGDTLARSGFSFHELSSVNPRLVWLSLTGYGRTGPLSNYLAYASNISGYVGLTAAWGGPDRSLSDYASGAMGVLGVLGALADADRTGRGAYLDVAQVDVMAQLMTPLLVGPLGADEGSAPSPGTPATGSWLAGVYRSRGEEAWLAVELEDAEDWSVLCTLLGRSDLGVADRESAEGRRRDLDTALAEWALERSPHTATHLLQKAGLAAGAVQHNEDIWRDPQLRARGFMVELPQPEYGVVHYPRPALRMSRSPGRLERSGPRLGEHTHDVLREWIDASDEELESWSESRAIFQAPE